MTLEPLVCVKTPLSYGKEAAAAAQPPLVRLWQPKTRFLSLGLKQPGGIMYIDANWKDGCLYSLTLTVHVKIVAAGTAYLESF